MKIFSIHQKVLFLLTILVFQSCKKDNLEDLLANNPDNEVISNADFGAVFFAQTHVRQPEDEGFKLVSDKDALVKVNMTADTGENAPLVQMILTLDGATETIALNGPATLSDAIDLRPGFIEHKFANSFTAMIPKAWIKPGLKVSVEAGDEMISFDDLNIGAPNKIIMNMFDVSFFQSSPGDYTEGWIEELETKLPVSEIELIRLPNIIFSELTIPPRKDANAVAARVSSKEDYLSLTGATFDGEQGAAAQWNRALKAAAGTRGRYALFYVNIYGVPAGGQAGGYAGVGNGTSLGVLNHELGHALSLPHWGDNGDYPYKGDMFGTDAPDNYKETHVGPVWGFDVEKNVFIPPTVQTNAVGGELGVYKMDPMQGGGTGDQEEGFLLRYFSDYSINKVQNYLEDHVVVAAGNNTYASWDATTKNYSNSIENNGVDFAVERDVDVISVMAGVSSVTDQATIVYPPVGPYKSGLIDIFDPTDEADRASAAAKYCPNGGCDVSVRIVQGGETKLFMLPLNVDASLDALDTNSLKTRAVNLRASDGSVTKIELLRTPDAEVNGLPSNPEILYSWGN